MEVHVIADIHLAALGGLLTGTGRCILKEAGAHEEPTQKQAPGRSCCL